MQEPSPIVPPPPINQPPVVQPGSGVTCVNVGSIGSPASNAMNGNKTPIANAGPSQTVSQGSLVTLDGTGSFAQNGATIVSYSWVQTSGTAVSLNGANTARPTFIAPTNSTALSFSLTVTNSDGVQSIVTPQSTASVIVR